jgi:hypothetical protein
MQQQQWLQLSATWRIYRIKRSQILFLLLIRFIVLNNADFNKKIQPVAEINLQRAVKFKINKIYLITPSSLPTLAKAAIALSKCSFS